MTITALYADERGEIYDAPGYRAVARVGGLVAELKSEDMIPLPEGAELMYLPGRPALMARKGKFKPWPPKFRVVAPTLLWG